MEGHPLNLAHQQHRRAEAHLKYNRFDEAMQCHQNAAELLLEAMKTTSSSVALESITLQHSYHLKQKDLIKTKKEQYNRVKKAVDTVKQQGRDTNVLHDIDHSKVQVAIYKNLNESKSILEKLSDPSNSADDENKRETKNGIEEIHNKNENLQLLVEKLVTQIELSRDENLILRDRVGYLEKERTRYLNLQISDFTQENSYSNITMPSLRRESQPEIPSLNQQPKGYSAGILRPIQQPHFDLSAFRDD